MKKIIVAILLSLTPAFVFCQTQDTNRDTFYEKYLKNQMFYAIVPLGDYIPELAALYDIHPLMTTVLVIFGSDGVGSFGQHVAIDFSKVRKTDDRGYLLQQQGLAEKFTKMPKDYEYTYTNGVLSMNGEQYKYNPTTGKLVDVKRKLSFEKEYLKVE